MTIYKLSYIQYNFTYNKHIQRIDSGLRDVGEIHCATVATKTTVTPTFAQAGRQVDHREGVVIVNHLCQNTMSTIYHGPGQGKNMGKIWENMGKIWENMGEPGRNLRLESM